MTGCRGRRVVALAAGALAVTAQAGTVCVEDTLPGRLADTPVRLCMETADGRAARYTLWLAHVQRIDGDQTSHGEGLQGDWHGHALHLRCTDTDTDTVRHCALTVDGEPAWRAVVEVPP